MDPGLTVPAPYWAWFPVPRTLWRWDNGHPLSSGTSVVASLLKETPSGGVDDAARGAVFPAARLNRLVDHAGVLVSAFTTFAHPDNRGANVSATLGSGVIDRYALVMNLPG